MANDSKVTFMCDESMANLLSKVSFDTDNNKPEIIRACILLSIDTVRNTPSLVQRIQLADRTDYRNLTR